MSDESEMERRIEATITSRLDAGTWYSPAINRLKHMTDAECDAAIAGDKRAEQFYRDIRNDCTCYPRGFISWSREVKAQQKTEHIKAGRHEIGCPMWVNPNPMYSRRGDTIPPSYTQGQARRDAETERVDYHPQRRFDA